MWYVWSTHFLRHEYLKLVLVYVLWVLAQQLVGILKTISSLGYRPGRLPPGDLQQQPAPDRDPQRSVGNPGSFLCVRGISRSR